MTATDFSAIPENDIRSGKYVFKDIFDVYNWFTSFSSTGTTLTAPMQSLQQVNNNDIRSRILMSVFRNATSNNHPSGIKPSKKGNNTGLVYASFCKDNVRLTAFAVSEERYSGADSSV